MTYDQIRKALERGKFIHANCLLYKLDKEGILQYRTKAEGWRTTEDSLSEFCDFWSNKGVVIVSTLKAFKESNRAW